MVRLQKKLIHLVIFLTVSSSLVYCTANNPARSSRPTEGVNISVPVSFSPNGDGLDDVWEIRGLAGYSSSEVNLYTTYGQLVYCSTGSYRAWDGIYKGRPVPAGNYYYVVKKAKKTRSIGGWMRIVR